MLASSKSSVGYSIDFCDSFLQIPVSSYSLRASCVMYKDTLYTFTRMGFGYRHAPQVMTNFSLCVLRALARSLEVNSLHVAPLPSYGEQYKMNRPASDFGRKGDTTILLSYVDDNVAICSNKQSSGMRAATYTFLSHIHLNHTLGIRTKLKKIIEPSYVLNFLGVFIPFKKGICELGAHRVRKVATILSTLMAAHTITVGQLRSCLGICMWCSGVVSALRPYTRALYHELHNAGVNNGAWSRPGASKRIKTTPIMHDTMRVIKALITAADNTPIYTSIRKAISPWVFKSDASLVGLGWHWAGKWGELKFPNAWTQYIGPHAEFRRINIHMLELYGVVLGLRHIAKFMCHQTLRIRCDSAAACGSLTRMLTRSPAATALLKEFCLLCSVWDISCEVTHLYGQWNCLCDAISRRWLPESKPDELAAMLLKASHLHKQAGQQGAFNTTQPARPYLVPLLQAETVHDLSFADPFTTQNKPQLYSTLTVLEKQLQPQPKHTATQHRHGRKIPSSNA